MRRQWNRRLVSYGFITDDYRWAGRMGLTRPSENPAKTAVYPGWLHCSFFFLCVLDSNVFGFKRHGRGHGILPHLSHRVILELSWFALSRSCLQNSCGFTYHLLTVRKPGSKLMPQKLRLHSEKKKVSLQYPKQASSSDIQNHGTS